MESRQNSARQKCINKFGEVDDDNEALFIHALWNKSPQAPKLQHKETNIYIYSIYI